MKHGTEYAPDLVETLGNLRYDVLTKFLNELAEKIKKDSIADAGRDRPHLSHALDMASLDLRSAANEIDEAWIISEPFMKDST